MEYLSFSISTIPLSKSPRNAFRKAAAEERLTEVSEIITDFGRDPLTGVGFSYL